MDRDFQCKKCGGWMEHIQDDEYVCDTCDEVVNILSHASFEDAGVSLTEIKTNGD